MRVAALMAAMAAAGLIVIGGVLIVMSPISGIVYLLASVATALLTGAWIRAGAGGE